MKVSKAVRIGAALADRYSIIREIGHGGMATVFLARDLKHEREVALKVLHRELGAALGADRFLAEIRTTAQLHHPNILPLFDSGEADGLIFFVMPFVEGETLRDRMTRQRQLGVTEAVRIAHAVATALDHAHRHGVVHRDIKPENILLQDGQAVVADFGISIAVSRVSGERITQTGFSVGTPQYMSPEQAAAERYIDGRSDEYSLASVLYEMLVGEPPFTGSNAQVILSRMMSEPAPDITVRRPSVPGAVAAAIHRALEKAPSERFATLAAFADAIAPPTRSTASHRVVTAMRRRAPFWGDWRTWLAAAAVVVAGAEFVAWHHRTAAQAVVSALIAPSGEHWLAGRGSMAISPDGKTLALVSDGHLVLRHLTAITTVTVPGTDGASLPFWSPDGGALAFFAAGKLMRVDLAGGAIHSLCPALESRGGSWGHQNTIMFAPATDSSPVVVPASGGTCRSLVIRAGRHAVSGTPVLLPDGRHFLLVSDTAIWIGQLQDSSVSRLGTPPGGRATFAAPDYLLFTDASGTSLLAQRLDLAHQALMGQPQSLLALGDGRRSVRYVSASSNGVVVVSDSGAAWMTLVQHWPALLTPHQ